MISVFGNTREAELLRAIDDLEFDIAVAEEAGEDASHLYRILDGLEQDYDDLHRSRD